MNRAPGMTRRQARELTFRVIFQADVAGGPLAEAWAARAEEEQPSADARSLVEDVLRALEARSAEVDETLRACAENWTIERLAATDRAVLRSAIAEMLARPGTPARVILDEAIEVARRYGSGESGPFVNGVLDRAAKRLRPDEF